MVVFYICFELNGLEVKVLIWWSTISSLSMGMCWPLLLPSRLCGQVLWLLLPKIKEVAKAGPALLTLASTVPSAGHCSSISKFVGTGSQCNSSLGMEQRKYVYLLS